MRKCVALAVLLAFGCATVRTPAGSVGDQVGPAGDVVAEPQIQLWLESGEAVSAAETSQARDQAREALSQALAARSVSPTPMGAADPVLVVRERGVSRTASRKRDQVGATVALVVGIVVVVAVIVAIAVSSKDSPKASVPKAPPAKVAPAAAVAPHAVPIPRPHATPVLPRPPPPVAVAAPAPWFYDPYPRFWFDLSFQIPPRPLVLRSEELDAPPVAAEAAEEDPPPPAPAEPPPLELPPPPDFDLEGRGFFSGDDSVLRFDLLDRATGKLLWSKTVSGGDARDPGDVRRMVNEALDSVTWAPRVRNLERASR